MKGNPITALSDLLGKLVIEHGSAVIQEKHIALLKEQFAILERENAKLKTEKDQLQSENKVLKTENKNLKNENLQLITKIKTYQKSTHGNLLCGEQLLILKCLSTLSGDTAIPLETIMSVCKLSEHVAAYHLQELEDDSMIECGYIDAIPHWYLDHDGRGYLIKHKILS